uniref:EF-hand domain-containing protein n=1 Tax=Eucampia antarctica TaxID=49252 RepID=A0A7S2RK57_9STRA|mmetsp:Transcript_23281/g.22339  ORF Transcript_23281/g.22339 Transcript_23281/m.22339 type:complete len:151 (+) Transcript_23281:179-631(+)
MPSQTKEENAKNMGLAVFDKDSDSGEICFANEFKDKVVAIHGHFDKDEDGFLNYEELRSLQLCTSGNDMDSSLYVMICSAFGCHPNKGVSIDALRLTYAAEGTDVDEDYRKVFEDSNRQKSKNEKPSKNKSVVEKEDDVYEVGENGVDIS